MKIKKLDDLQIHSEMTKWLVKDLILKGGLTTLVASPKSTKSFFALDLAISVATGTSCLSHFSVPNRGKVLLYSGEDTEGILSERITGIMKGKALRNIDNLGILSSPDGLRLDKSEDVQRLRSQIDEFGPDLLILDCFYSLHRISENDSGSVVSVLEILRELRREFGCAILLVHHTSKDSDSKNLGARIRGSSAFHGFFETILGLRRKSDNNQILLDIEHRAAPSVSDIPIELISEETGIKYRVVTTALVETISHCTDLPIEKQILNCVQSRHFPITLFDIAKHTKREVGEVRNSIFLLIKSGQIKYTSKGYLRGEIH